MSRPMDVIGRISVRNVHEVEWRIGNFGSYSLADAEYASPHFNVCGSVWLLVVLPNGQTSDGSSGYVSLYLFGVSVTPPSAVCASLGVRRNNGTVERFGRDFTWVFEVDYDSCGSPRFLERSELLRRREELAPAFEVTFTCNLRTQKDWFGYSRSLDSLSRDMMDLFASKRGCDSVLVVRGRTFAVHRWILAARSSVFAAMFGADMREKSTGAVEIPDCDPASFELFLEFLYCGRLERGRPGALAPDLYRIAHKYDVEDLRVYCTLCIMLGLSTENVLETYLLAHQFGEQTVRLRTEYFFAANFDRIVDTAKWDEFLAENPELANQLLKFVAERKNGTTDR